MLTESGVLGRPPWLFVIFFWFGKQGRHITAVNLLVIDEQWLRFFRGRLGSHPNACCVEFHHALSLGFVGGHASHPTLG